MIYHFLLPLADSLPGIGVVRYLSFRSAWALITALCIAYFLFPPFIAWMTRQKMNQVIREDGPESHRLEKLGTPTMGGVCLLFSVFVSVALWARWDTPFTAMAMVIMLGYGLIGFIDDWKKVIQKSTDGLAGRYKILLQLLFGGLVLGYGAWSGAIEPILPLPFFKDSVIDFATLIPGFTGFSMIYTLFGLFILVGASNAVNLTDGLDGLAIGPVMTSAFTYGVIAYMSGHAGFSAYLGITHIAGAGELTILCAALVGAGLGFLWYNAHPAQIFMGDVGSLSLGGTLAIVAILTHHELLLALVGGIFVLEAVSVILQVGSFKLRKKRIFAMAPIHHHYEKKGWSETKIVIRFWIISLVMALVALSTLKLR